MVAKGLYCKIISMQDIKKFNSKAKLKSTAFVYVTPCKITLIYMLDFKNYIYFKWKCYIKVSILIQLQHDNQYHYHNKL